MRRVARLYRDNALRFTCEEKIVYQPRHGRRGVHKFAYVYAANPAGALLDYRTERSGQDPLAEALEPTRVPEYVTRAYSWVFIFEEKLQQLYHYEILGQARMKRRPAVRVRFEPIHPVREDVNDWHGTAWIDLESFQLLRVEGLKHREFETRARFRADLRSPPAALGAEPPTTYLVSTVATEFDEVRNGMRFPTKVVVARSAYRIRMGAYRKKSRELPQYSVVQTYRNYRFFGVRTTEEIQGFVRENRPLAPR